MEKLPLAFNPVITKLKETTDNYLVFTLSGVDVTFANAIRRTILSDIPVVAFTTQPVEKCDAIIYTNTTQQTNQELLHQLSQIPIFYKKYNDEAIQDFLLEVNVQNKSETVLPVTTKDFKIKITSTNSYLAENTVKRMFPCHVSKKTGTEHFIELARLRPKSTSFFCSTSSSSVEGEDSGDKLHFTCRFSVRTAKENGVYVVASICSYSMTIDETKQQKKLQEELIPKWKTEGKNASEEIEFETENWLVLDGCREVLANSFDFRVETVGTYTNRELVTMACDILMDRLSNLIVQLSASFTMQEEAIGGMEKCFLITLEEGTDFTLGYLLDKVLYFLFFEGGSGHAVYSFCGFNVRHKEFVTGNFRIAFRANGKEESAHHPPTTADYRQILMDHFQQAALLAKKVFLEMKNQIMTLH